MMDSAFEWIMQNGGLESDDTYDYDGEEGPCWSHVHLNILFFLFIYFT